MLMQGVAALLQAEERSKRVLAMNINQEHLRDLQEPFESRLPPPPNAAWPLATLTQVTHLLTAHRCPNRLKSIHQEPSTD